MSTVDDLTELRYYRSVHDTLVDYTVGDWVTAITPTKGAGNPLELAGVEMAVNNDDPVRLTADRARRLGEALVHAAALLDASRQSSPSA